MQEQNKWSQCNISRLRADVCVHSLHGQPVYTAKEVCFTTFPKLFILTLGSFCVFLSASPPPNQSRRAGQGLSTPRRPSRDLCGAVWTRGSARFDVVRVESGSAHAADVDGWLWCQLQLHGFINFRHAWQRRHDVWQFWVPVCLSKDSFLHTHIYIYI